VKRRSRRSRGGSRPAAWAVLVAIAGVPQIGFSQSPIEVRVTPSKSRVRVDDFITVDIRAVAKVQGDIRVDIPDVDGLTEVSRSNYQSSSFSFSNGRQTITREQVITLEYVADHAGSVTIPPVTARVGQRTARSSAVAIVVEPRPARSDSDAGPVPPGRVHPPAPDERDVFLRYRTNTNEAFVGEQIVIDLVLFTRPGASLSADDLGPPPSPDGFWREVIEDQPRLRQLGRERVEGEVYRTYLRWRVALFPLGESDLELEPTSATFRTGSTFGRGRRLRRATRPLRVTVVPLPEQGRPDDFATGNVGDFTLEASVDERSIDTGQGVMLTLRMSGRGNIRNARLPEVAALEDFRVFPPTRSDDVDTANGEVRGSKTAELLLTPKRSGRLEIPRFGIWVFDPETASYHRRTTEPIAITARGEATARAPVEPSPPAAPSEPASGGPEGPWRPVRPEPRLSPERPPWRMAWFFPALGAPWVGAAAWALARRRRATARPAFDRKASQQRLESALASGRAPEAWGAFGDALREALAHRFEPSVRNAAPAEARARLRAAGVPSDRADAVHAALESADFARYAADLAPEIPPDASTRWRRLVEEVARS